MDRLIQWIINVLKLANNNEVSFLQEKVEYLRTEIDNLELKKTECTNHVLTLNRRVDDLTETVNMYESSLNEKREEIAFLNREQKRPVIMVIRMTRISKFFMPPVTGTILYARNEMGENCKSFVRNDVCNTRVKVWKL